MNSGVENERVLRAQELSKNAQDGISELVAMLIDPSWVVRRAVIRSLAGLGEKAVQPVCDILLFKRDNEARIAAAVDTLVLTAADVETAVFELAENANPAIVADAAQILGRRRNYVSIAVLVKLSQHEDDNVAVGAIEALGRIGGRAAVEAMVDSIRSENFFRVFPAIDVLGRSGDPRAVGPLAKLLDHPNYLHEATRALGKTGERSAVKPLVKILKSTSDAAVRVAALALMDLREKFAEKSGGETLVIDELIKTHSQLETVQTLIRVLSNADRPESVAICTLLGAIRNAAASSVLAASLDASGPVAQAAANAIKKIGSDTDEVLAQALKNGSSERRRALLPIVMRFALAKDVADCLTDDEAEVRALACETLARLGNGSTVANIFPLLGDANARVVHAAISAIQSLGTRTAHDLAMEAARSSNKNIRRSALRILAYFGDDQALKPILAGLKDEDSRVREAAIQALPYLESPHALVALLEETKSSLAKTRAQAIRALGLVPHTSELVISTLLKGLKDSDPWVRYYACQALGRLGLDMAAPAIVHLLNDGAGQVRVSAVEALSHLKSTEANQALRQAAASDEIEIRRAALVGLGFSQRLEDLPVVLTGTKSKDISTRLMALSSLSGYAHAQATEALCKAAADHDEQVSSTAINFLAARTDKRSTECLVAHLGKELTRDRARIALQVPSKGRMAALLEILESANDESAPQLVSILSRMDRADARIALLSAFKLNNPAARKAAANGLAARREPEMISALQEAAQVDSDPEVRQICKLLLHD